MYLRFIFFVLVFALVSACSRTNDLIVPPQQVKSDPDCSLPALAESPFISFRIEAVNEGALVSKTLFDSEFSGFYETLSFELPLAPLSSKVAISAEVQPPDSVLSLVNGDTVLFSNVSVLVKNGQGEVVFELPLDEPFGLIDVAGHDEILVELQADASFVEQRSECFYLGERSSESSDDDEEEQTSQVVREIDASTTLELSVIRDLATLNTNTITRTVTDPAADNMRGFSVSTNGVATAVGEPDAGAGRVILHLSDVGECGVVSSSNGRDGDRFGATVLLRGTTLYVGAPFEDGSLAGVHESGSSAVDGQAYTATDSGAVYLYDLSTNEFGECFAEERYYFKAINNSGALLNPQSNFGASIAISGRDLFIGAPNRYQTVDGASAPVGSVEQFSFNDGTWQASSGQVSLVSHIDEMFGAAVSATDRFLVIGAPGDSTDVSLISPVSGVSNALSAGDKLNLVSASGAAYIYVRDSVDDLFQFLGYLKPESLGLRDRFGAAVSITGSSLFIGAPFDDSASAQVNFMMFDDSLENAGAVYRYDIDEDGIISLTDYIKSRQPEQGAKFGSFISAEDRYLAVANPGIVGDFNGYSAVKGHVEVIDHTTYDDPLFVSVFEDDQSNSALSANVEALDLYGGTLVLGLPKATINAVNESGAFAIW